MVHEEHRQVRNNADHGCGDAGQRGREFQVAMGGLDEGPTRQDKEERWQESKEGDNRRRDGNTRGIASSFRGYCAYSYIFHSATEPSLPLAGLPTPHRARK